MVIPIVDSGKYKYQFSSKFLPYTIFGVQWAIQIVYFVIISLSLSLSLSLSHVLCTLFISIHWSVVTPWHNNTLILQEKDIASIE
jgi:hypothetical protein